MPPARKIKNLFSEYLPADGTTAAFNWRDYGRSRWQLSDQDNPFAGMPGRCPYVSLTLIEHRMGGVAAP
jgi:hypothetical protein